MQGIVGKLLMFHELFRAYKRSNPLNGKYKRNCKQQN